MNLYWCETMDHDEDWFIVAPSAKEARRLHEDAEGYGRGDAQATLVARIPKALNPSAGHPTHELLRSLGAVFISEETPRAVRLALLCTRKAVWMPLLTAFQMTKVKHWDTEGPIGQHA